GAHRTLILAQSVMIVAAAAGVVVTALGALTLASYLVLIALFAVASGSTMGPGSALAVGLSGRTAGTGSALLGFIQYVVGAAAAPLGGIMGTQTALPAMTMMLVFAALALACALLAAAAQARTPHSTEP